MHVEEGVQITGAFPCLLNGQRQERTSKVPMADHGETSSVEHFTCFVEAQLRKEL